jgi:hypothetical protein
MKMELEMSVITVLNSPMLTKIMLTEMISVTPATIAGGHPILTNWTQTPIVRIRPIHLTLFAVMCVRQVILTQMMTVYLMMQTTASVYQMAQLREAALIISRMKCGENA